MKLFIISLKYGQKSSRYSANDKFLDLLPLLSNYK